MSFDPTCRATQGATARPRADSPPPPPAVGATPAAAAAEPLSRQFDQLLRLDSGVGRSSRSQSIADRPRATLPASPASVPERLARLKGALVSYREKNAAAAPGRTAAQLRAIAEPAFRQANEALELLEGLKGPLRAKAVAEQLPAFVYQMRVSAAYQLAGAPPKDEALVLAINAVAHDGTPRELLLALLLKGIEHFDRRHEHAQRYKPILQAAIDKYGTPKGVEACRKLPLAQLAAAHFKSEEQRGHGATWERLHGALGQIHRGQLRTPAVLKELQRRMA